METNMAEEEEQSCKICYCEGTSGNELYCPCKCTGSIKFVHESCLQNWLQVCCDKASQSCEVCSTPYRYQKVYGHELVSTNKIIQILQACMADANVDRVWQVAFSITIITVGSTAICFAICMVFGGHTVVTNLEGLTDWDGLFSRFLWKMVASLVVMYIPVALVYHWRFTEAWNKISRDLTLARAYYCAQALALRKEQAMFGLEDLLSLQHRHAMAPKPMMLDAQVTYVAQLSASYARTTETAAVVGDEQLIRTATNRVSGVLSLQTVPVAIRRGKKGLTEALHLADDLNKIEYPEPVWLVRRRLLHARIDVRIQRLVVFDLAPVHFMCAFIVYELVGCLLAPRAAYFIDWAAACIHTLLSSQDRVKWVLHLIYASSAGFDDAPTLALLHQVFAEALAKVLAMITRFIVGGIITRIFFIALIFLCPLMAPTKPLYGIQAPAPTKHDALAVPKHGTQVLTVYAALYQHVCPTLLFQISTWLSIGLLCILFPVVMSVLVWRALGQPSLTVSLCAAMYCGCVCFYTHARRLLTQLRKVLAPWYTAALRDLYELSSYSLLALCLSVWKLTSIVLLLFVAIVVLPIRFGHWLCPGAAQMVLTEGAGESEGGDADTGTSTPVNSADAFLLLVHGFCMGTLLFHTPLQRAACKLLTKGFCHLAILLRLESVLAPPEIRGLPFQPAVPQAHEVPAEALDLVGLIEQAPRWPFEAFSYAVLHKKWHPYFRVVWSPFVAVPALLSVCTCLEGLSVVSRLTLLVILFLAGNFVLSSWLLHVPLLVGNCVHTALFGAAGMPMPTVGVFQYCTGAMCCALALYVVKGICGEVRRKSDSTVLDMVCVAGKWLQRAGAVLAVGLLWATVPSCMVGYLLISTYTAVFTSSGGPVSYECTVWDCGFWGGLGMLLLEWVLSLQVFANVHLAIAVKQVRREGLAGFQAVRCLRSVVLPVCLMLLDCAVLPYFVARCAGMLFVHSYHVRARLVQCCHLVYLALYVAGWSAGPLYEAYLRWYDALFLVAIKLKNYEEKKCSNV